MNEINSSILALKSTQVVLNGELRPAQILVEHGKISQIADFETKLSVVTEDLGDQIIMPGLVDTHVHINEPGRTEWEGFNTGTQSAAAGGITCVVDMPLNCTPVTTSVEAFKQKLDSLVGKLWIDCGFWGGVIPDSLNDLDQLIQAAMTSLTAK